MKKLLLCGLILIAGCDRDEGELRRDAENNVHASVPVMIATVDGVKLWKVRDRTGGGADYVYFTSHGDTYSQTSCGKNCIRRTLVTGE